MSMITCIAFNADYSQIALCPGDNSICVYSIPALDSEISKWTKLHTLVRHDSCVSSIDWSDTSNLIVSCGHDRNAYVWSYDSGKDSWDPTLVILRINRAANWVRWCADGTKFAVASSAKMVPVCRYEQSNNWWVSKMIKKHKSTVLTLCWHPNNVFLLTGCCDGKCRIFSAFIKDLDEIEDDRFDAIFPKQNSFGSLLAEIDLKTGWVEGVCWNPNGMEGAFVSHDPAITFFKLEEGAENSTKTQKIELQNLPYRVVSFLDENRAIAAGHDNNPHLFVRNGDEWGFKEKLDKEKGVEEKGGKVSLFAANKALFQKTTTRGAFDAAETLLKTRHQNQIVGVRTVTGSDEFFTCGLDGNVFHWKC